MVRIGRLRWGMLALMFAGTVVVYVDRSVLGVLAPILKKEVNLHHRAIFLRRLVVPDRLFLRPAGRRLSHRPARPAHRLRRRRPRLGPRRGAARSLDRLDLDGGLPRAAGSQRSGGDPDRDQNVDVVVPLARALDRHRLVQLRFVDRRGAHPAARHLHRRELGLASGVSRHRRARRRRVDRLVDLLSRPRQASQPVAGRARLHLRGPRAAAGRRRSRR